jgi:hypothetical protein
MKTENGNRIGRPGLLDNGLKQLSVCYFVGDMLGQAAELVGLAASTTWAIDL